MINQGASTSSVASVSVPLIGSCPLEANGVLQLKVSLTGLFKPPIWRRLLVPNKYTFIQLHDCIRDCMGWSDRHLHQFSFGTRRSPTVIIGKKWGYCDEFSSEEFADEKTTTLSQFLSVPKDSVEYVYDLGGSWYHKVTVEKVLPVVDGMKYPVCIAGRQFPPPEDESPYHSDDEDYEEPEPMAPKIFDPKLIVFNVRPSLTNLVAA